MQKFCAELGSGMSIDLISLRAGHHMLSAASRHSPLAPRSTQNRKRVWALTAETNASGTIFWLKPSPSSCLSSPLPFRMALAANLTVYPLRDSHGSKFLAQPMADEPDRMARARR